MIATVPKARADRSMILLDKAKKRAQLFRSLHPRVVTSVRGVRDSLARATKNTLWISYEKDLTEALVAAASGPVRPLGTAVLIHRLSPETIPALTGHFKRFAFAAPEGCLPPDELAEALTAENSADLFIAGSVDPSTQTIALWRGNLDLLTVPFSAFENSADGVAPDFERFSVTDHGQTVRLGDYEAATDAVLYEFDPEYRRRIGKQRQQSERSLGASLRRLRKQRGLRREDFEPQVAAKTIARIEQGKVTRVRPKTLATIARRLRVKPDEIETF